MLRQSLPVNLQAAITAKAINATRASKAKPTLINNTGAGNSGTHFLAKNRALSHRIDFVSHFPLELFHNRKIHGGNINCFQLEYPWKNPFI
jgi:hypothetical protein